MFLRKSPRVLSLYQLSDNPTQGIPHSLSLVILAQFSNEMKHAIVCMPFVNSKKKILLG